MLQNAQLSRNINGVHTDVVLQTFSDRIIVLVTQVGKVGNLHLRPDLSVRWRESLVYELYFCSTATLCGREYRCPAYPKTPLVSLAILELTVLHLQIQATLPSTIPLLPAPPPPPPSSDPNSHPTSPLQTPPHRPLPPPHPSTELTSLLGSAPTPSLQALHSLYTSHIATIVWTTESGMMGQGRRGVVVGLALKRSPNANAGAGRGGGGGADAEEGARMGEGDTELFRSVMDMCANRRQTDDEQFTARTTDDERKQGRERDEPDGTVHTFVAALPTNTLEPKQPEMRRKEAGEKDG
ncbi:uncharacterized protein STEHIDRAFT_113967 [Stereum hirsutum FP-91666 SS1]|uniref:uncharacterized protein n=1 Tax=Stereum hirsutum (strain FP-91666) TaxID=721885 RepID=UPI0004449F82|nr:uncharacterized protein STEHIDRAFT_113967 [Stereum hirsutum FP-91666 SS1]EIM82885.1 hypothetical protein STEHIDRAFT_113967 [Stereum hirsutum FP-91666 SS1]